ncbi:MAG: hypothetical protein Q8N05_03060 [Bacteroidota bacterium]|nr:hypothetical protein [Bacteroidota bacterium]
MEPIIIPQLLLIAGTGRNTGKTTLVCNILRKFSLDHSIISLKITPHFHRNIQSGKVIIDESNLYLAEETDSTTGKDSSLMLQAGALQSFFVMANDEHLDTAFQEIGKRVPSGSLLVCESGGLRYHVVPGLFFMMSRSENAIIKPASEKLKLLADCMITFDGEKLNFDLDSIEITDNKWTLKH